MDDTLHITITGEHDGFEPFRDRMREFAVARGLPGEAAFKATLAVDELVANIIAYGYDAPGAQHIEIALTITDQAVTLRVEDDARPFNPLDHPRPETDQVPEERSRPVGGLGIHFTRHCMPNATYSREGGRNVLVLSRPREAAPRPPEEPCQ